MTKKSTTQKGQEAEQQAVVFLEKEGYEILETNYRYKRAEIDIICLQANWLVFVEVKARRSSAFGYPEAAISKHKSEMVYGAAEDYIYAINWKGLVRYDVISIDLLSGEITHLVDGMV